MGTVHWWEAYPQHQPPHTPNTMTAKPELSARDADRVKFTWDVFDFSGNGTVDRYYIGDLLRALNLNPTNAVVDKFEPEKTKGVKFFKMEEFIPMFLAVKKDKDCGSYEDFTECLKLYDKMEDGTMLVAELEYLLKNLGEILTKEDVNEALAELAPPVDEEGLFMFDPFLRKLCEKNKNRFR